MQCEKSEWISIFGRIVEKYNAYGDVFKVILLTATQKFYCIATQIYQRIVGSQRPTRVLLVYQIGR